MLWAHMHDEQIKEEDPKSRFAKESISPVLLQHARVVLRNGYWLSVLDRECPLFYQQCKSRDVENSTLIGHRMTQPLSVSSSSSWLL